MNLGSGYLSLRIHSLHGACGEVRQDESEGPGQVSAHIALGWTTYKQWQSASNVQVL